MHSIHLIATAAIVANGLDLYFNFYFVDETAPRETLDTKLRLFLNNCEALLARYSWRLVIDSATCLALPALLSGILYCLIGHSLAKRSRNASRNRSLTIAFGISWLCWIICWTPNYVGMSFHLGKLRDSDSWFTRTTRGSWVSEFNKYFVVLRMPLQILYSYLNPLIFLIVFKPFRKWLIYSLSKLCFKRNETSGAKREKVGLLKNENFKEEHAKAFRFSDLLIVAEKN